MKTKSFYFTVIIVLIATHVLAQRLINGKAVSKDGKPMNSVVVKIKNHDISTITNSEGKFKIWLPENIKTFEFSDYKNIRIEEVVFKDYNNVQLVLSLQTNIQDLFAMSLQELMRIKIITAGKTEETASDIPASVVVITRSEIETYGYNCWEEILEYILGVYKINEYHFTGTEGFGMRGFYSPGFNNNMAILVNGIKQMEFFANSFNTANITVPVEAIDRIEVIRGPMSVIYGSSSFFGAVNIITNKFKDNGLISTGYGNYGNYKVFARVSKKSEDFDYTCNIGIFGDKGLDVPYSDMISSPQEWWQDGADLSQTTKNRLEKRSAYFDFSGRYKDFYTQIGYNLNFKDVQQIMPALGDGNAGRFSALNFMTGYKKSLTNKLDIDIRITGFEFNYYAQYSVFKDTDYFAYNSSVSNAYKIELRTRYSPFDNMNITFGLVRNTAFNLREEYDVPAFGEFVENNTSHLPDKQKINTNSFYLQTDLDITTDIKAIAGIRVEQTERYDAVIGKMVATPNEIYYFGSVDATDLVFIPRLALIYKPNNHHIIKLLYGEATKNPSYNQNYANIPFADIAPLKPERIRTYEINYLCDFSNLLNINFSVFHNELVQLILQERDDINNQWWNANGGEVTTNGFELATQLRPTNWAEIIFCGTFLKTENVKSDVKMAFSPKYIIQGSAAVKFPGNIRFALSGRYIDKMLSTWNPTNEVRNGPETEAYFIMNANLRIEKILRGLFANISCTNILNREIRYPTGDNNAFFDKGTLGKGRMLLFLIGYKF